MWLDIFFRKLTHCHSVLPYNINWRRKDWRLFSAFFQQYPIHVVDVGARDGAPAELEGLEPFINYVAFDADERETQRLNAAPHPYRSLAVLPYFVGGSTGMQRFFLYKNLGESSALEPNAQYVQFYKNLAIDSKIEVAAVTLDGMLSEGKIADVDVLKLDTQGTEFEILASATRVLGQALLVETEVEFVELYKGQKLSFDLEKMMHDNGFEILYLNRVFLNRRAYEGPSRGQLIFGDILFGLGEERAKLLPYHKKTIYLALLLQYGHMDFAHALFKQSPDLQREFPNVVRLFSAKVSVLGRLKQVLVMQLDKILAYMLHLRGTNRLRSDSDRNWPTR
jgi:FkbM family methyltransferase